jgi:hypothetical protein
MSDAPAKSLSSNRHNWLFTFFDRHYKWIAVAAGLLVSLILSLRDSLHEQVRDVANAVDSAVMFGRIQQLNQATNAQLDDVLIRVRALTEPAAFGRRPMKLFYDNLSIDTELWKSETQENLDGLKSLQPFVSEDTTLPAKITELSTQFNNIDREAQLDRSNGNEDNLGTSKQYHDLLKNTMNLRSYMYQILDEKKGFLERREHFFTFISYAIIAVGVGLSLTAKLFEHKDEDTVEVAM